MSARALKLYVAASCPFCHRVEIVAREKQLSYERVLVGLREEMPDWYKAINPRETVPTLEVGGGSAGPRHVFESTLIAQYLDNSAAPAGALMGQGALQRHQIEFFLSQAGDFIGAAHALLGAPVDAEKHQALDDNAAYVDGLIAANQTTGPYFCDADFTLADVALVPFLVRLKPALQYYAGYDVFRKAPRMKALWAAAAQRASVRETSPTAEQSVEGYRHLVPETAPMMAANGGYVLYSSVISPFADRARLACALRKVKVHLVEVPLHPTAEWFKYVNPRELVPALITPRGEAVHESQLIVNYVDHVATEGTPLVPRGDAEKEYEVSLFVDNADRFIEAMTPMVFGRTDTVNEVMWAAGELEKQLATHPFGEGPFFGGKVMNAADVAILPLLIRAKAFAAPGGFDLLAQFPLLNALTDAGLANPDVQAVCLKPEEYRDFLMKLREGAAAGAAAAKSDS
ncbi:thiol-dependent reductase 1 [Novymonas esmeraldas]|uniref:Thiol-dependent reductase 1 n=1 Tax=Novymonas esmeraldas TaxID=1808958 RepID=A0AAW0EUJ5_9TRYP